MNLETKINKLSVHEGTSLYPRPFPFENSLLLGGIQIVLHFHLVNAGLQSYGIGE